MWHVGALEHAVNYSGADKWALLPVLMHVIWTHEGQIVQTVERIKANSLITHYIDKKNQWANKNGQM